MFASRGAKGTVLTNFGRKNPNSWLARPGVPPGRQPECTLPLKSEE